MPAPALTPVSGTALPAGPTLIAAVPAGATLVTALQATPLAMAAPERAGPAVAAVAAGASLVDLGTADRQLVAAFTAACPEAAFCAEHERADVVRSAALARATGAALLCRGPAEAITSSLPPGRLLVEVPPGDIGAALEAGWLPLVDVEATVSALDGTDRGAAAGIAVVALSAWLGAAAIRTSQPRPARRALDMIAAVAGLRAPARTVRGLA